MLLTLLLLLMQLVAEGAGGQLTVSRGASTFIQPADVTFQQPRVHNVAHCKISVDLQDLSTLQVGTVQPHVRQPFAHLLKAK